MKAAIIVLSDPHGGEESVGRVFNALGVAYDYKLKGDEVTVIFMGAGTRWVTELSKPEHLVHALFNEVKDTVAGVSCGCADVFNATEDVEKSAFDLIGGNPIPGTNGGSPSLHKLVSEGYTIMNF